MDKNGNAMRSLPQPGLNRSRRVFMGQLALGTGLVLTGCSKAKDTPFSGPSRQMRLGLATSGWGSKWHLDRLLRNCEKIGIQGVELQIGQAHRITPSLSAMSLRVVKNQFARSRIEFVGFDSNLVLDPNDGDALRSNANGAKALVALSAELGGSGVRFRYSDAAELKTSERQLLLDEVQKLADFAHSRGQELRLQPASGGPKNQLANSDLMRAFSARNVGIASAMDFDARDLRASFDRRRDQLRSALLIGSIRDRGFPYEQLAQHLVVAGFLGWILLEGSGEVADELLAIAEHRRRWLALVALAQDSL
ncbi:MAG: hypothetical protein V3W41_13175 [Planctomycetota bacterium]